VRTAAPARARSSAPCCVWSREYWFVLRRYINITNMMEVADLHICDVLLQVRTPTARPTLCGLARHGICLCTGSDRAVVTSMAAGVSVPCG
jgi:hypothetical protein